MPLPVTCPHCGKGYNLAAELLGKKIRCKACQETFVVKDTSASDDDADEDEVPDKKGSDRLQTSPRSTRKSAPVRQVDVDEDEDRPRRKNQKRPAKKESSGVPVLLIVGGIAALLIVVLGAGAAIWVFSSKSAAAPAPVAQAGGAPPAPVVPQPPVQPAKSVQPAVNPMPVNPPPVNPPPSPPPSKVEDKSLVEQPPPGWQQYIGGNNRWYGVWIPANGWKGEQTKSVPIQGTLLKFTTMHFETRDKIKLQALAVSMTLKPGEQLERFAVMEIFRDIYLKEHGGGTVASESEAFLGTTPVTRVPGMEYLLDLKDGGKAKFRVFPAGLSAKLGNATIYQVAVAGTKEQIEGETAKLFLSSFKHGGMLREEAKMKAPPDKKP